MGVKAAIANRSPKDAHLPAMHKVGDLIAPTAPQEIAASGMDEEVLTGLVVKLGSIVSRFTTEWVSKRLHLSPDLTSEILGKLCHTGSLQQTLKSSQTSAHYKITEGGLQHASRLMDLCGYVGPAPVDLKSYASMLHWQFANTPSVLPEHVASALSGLVLSQKVMDLAGLAVSSGRSLFVYGPPGNGKSSLARQIHAALPGDYWIPYSISVSDTVIRLFDAQCHERVNSAHERDASVDQRWVRIRRPLVVVAGELTLDLLDLIFMPSQRYYEAPPHLKANGGVFLIDDFGRERVEPEQLLNRLITPMEHQLDYFSLRTGQKIQVPLRNVTIIATNLSPDVVTDKAFLRRMGYRINLESPTPEEYALIFKNYAERHGAVVTPEIIDQLLERYRAQRRELRACEPRDLIERARDICRFQGRPLELSPQVLDLAWIGYFGDE